jgi:thymidylate synthase (FAD)
MKIVQPSVSLISVTPFPEKVIERCARNCYKSEDRITEDSHVAMIKALLKRDHTAMFEFADACFSIVCDRGVSHELVRHRIASFAQESTRYCNYGRSGEITVIMPPMTNEDDRFDWEVAAKCSEENYLSMVERGCPAQIARSVLPNSLKTEVMMKTNFRSWRNFLKLRLAPAAHPQMREIAFMLRDQLLAIAPNVFSDFADFKP